MAIDRRGSAAGGVGAATAPRPGRLASDRSATVGLGLVDLLLPWAVGVATTLTRLATAAVGPTDWDSSQYAAAVGRFDVTHGRPQPPGYFLYVVAGRVLHAVGLAPVHALVVASALASGAAAGFVVVAGRDLGGRWVGAAAGLLVAMSPFAWFSGSIVSTYSFDLLIAPVLIILAWRARPHSWHGAAALAALGLAAGFRQSTVQAFGLLALLAVAGSVRRAREAVLAVAAGAAAVVVWFVPMALTQPGGVHAWTTATRLETTGAFQATSVLDHAAAGATNLGTFAAYTAVALAPLALVALLAGVVLGARRLLARSRNAPPDGTQGVALPGPTADGVRARPWYQSRTAILLAATVPPMAVVALVQFAKGGYLLAYLPGAVIALLLVPAALFGARPGTTTPSPTPTSATSRRVWMILASTLVVVVAALGAQRFLSGAGVLPSAATTHEPGLWLTQARYQAPFADTRSAIRLADSIDSALADLAPSVRSTRDVVVIDSVDGGITFYRNAGWELPRDRVALIVPGAVVYNEQHNSLYYASGSAVQVGPGGVVYLIAPPDLPGLGPLAGAGKAVEVTRATPIADYRVWRVEPGSSLLGVAIDAVAGPRPLGSGLGEPSPSAGTVSGARSLSRAATDSMKRA